MAKKVVSVDSRMVALSLIMKMVRYERSIDSKAVKSKAEERHVRFLRALRDTSVKR